LPDFHFSQNIFDCDSTHPTRAVLKSYLRFFPGIMKGVDQETGILAPRSDPCRAVIAIKPDNRFAECTSEMQWAGIGRDDQVAPIKNGNETSKTTTQCFLRGMETFTRHFFAQG
jgi:hypothetical protein